MRNYEKVSFVLSPDERHRLNELSAQLGVRPSETLRRLIGAAHEVRPATIEMAGLGNLGASALHGERTQIAA